jgi:diguanylate cyclase (GGDEF)-like protein/PAS domain S-box-containing protein
VQFPEAIRLLDAVRVELQVWEATGDGPADLALRWSNQPADGDAAPRWVEPLLRGALDQRAASFTARDGDAWYRTVLQPLGDRRVLASYEDVTAEQERERALAASAQFSERIVASLQEGVFVVDRGGRITRTNEAAARLAGSSLGELTGSFLSDLPIDVLRPDGTPLPLAESPAVRALAGEEVRGLRLQAVRRDGTTVWIEVNSSPLCEADGSLYGAVSTYTDVTERVHRERRMRREAESDPLTGLANRRALERALDAALARARATGRTVAVLVADLDDFKALNDRWGHMAGDEALREVARRLLGCVRERDVVSRTGGDEFVIVLGDLLPGEGTPRDCAERVAAALDVPIALAGGASVELGAATGVACFPGDGEDAAALLAHADRAMYAAKR